MTGRNLKLTTESWNPRVRRFKKKPFSYIPIKRKINNFGDILGPIFVKKICKALNSRTTVVEVNENPNGQCLFTIGSVMRFAKTNDLIWGSGINGKNLERDQFKFEALDIRMVRGPRSREYLEKIGIKCPEIYGDPGLLLPMFFPEYSIMAAINPRKEHKRIFVPNLYDINNFKVIPDNVKVINPTTTYTKVIESIAKCTEVIGTSLHAIIIAESLGIPAKIVLSRNESPFKYEDYLLSTGRNEMKFYDTIEQAIKGKPLPPPKYSIESMLRSFPIDYIL